MLERVDSTFAASNVWVSVVRPLVSSVERIFSPLDWSLPVRRWAVLRVMRTLALVRCLGQFVAGRCVEWRSASDCAGRVSLAS